MALLKGFGLFNTCVSSHTSKIRSRSLTSLDSSALILFLILLCFFDTVLHDRTPRKLNTVLPCSAPYWYRVYAGVKKKKSPALLADGSELDISPHCATLLFRWVLTGYRFALCLIAVLWFQLSRSLLLSLKSVRQQGSWPWFCWKQTRSSHPQWNITVHSQ